MKPIRVACTLREEVLKGDLEDSIFAADFGHVVEGRAAPVYQNPETFFRNTHPSANLKKLVGAVFERLANPDESGAAVRLSTGFGGGKTHTLITFWHLAQTIQSTSLGTDLLPAAGRPSSVTVVGIDGSKGFTSGTLWGDVALKLGVLSVEDARTLTDSPDASTLAAWLPKQPLLILLDELVIPMSEMDDQAQGALLAFLNRLVGEIGARRQAVLVITDPAGQTAYQQQAQAIGAALAKLTAARRLDDVLGRKFSDFDPIGDEAPQVINRRLFTHIDPAAASASSAEYYSAFKRVQEADPTALPAGVVTADYAKRFVQCYPFHPRLLDTAQDRLAAMQDFQKGRGTLRLFARILRDVWEAESEIPLITAGDINWQSQRIQGDLLGRLDKDQFKAAVAADVRDHAGQLDAELSTDIHRRVASALLLESLPMTPSAGLDKRDLALATLRPSDVGHEPAEAMDRLMAVCWHTYKDDSGTRYQFRYQPNLNKQIEERAANIPWEDARAAVHAQVQQYFTGQTFQLAAFPSSPRQVSDSARLKLVLADSEAAAQAVCNFEDNSDPDAPRRRRFRNAIFAVAPTPHDLNEAIQAKRRESAAADLAKEKKDDPLQKQQLDDLLTGLRRTTRIAAARAFNRVLFQGRASLSLEEKYLVARDAALDTVFGQSRLKQFLDEKKLIYQPSDAIDVDLLLEHIVAGSTPALDHAGAVTAKSVHERALANEKLRLMLNADPVRNSVRNAVKEGRLLVRIPTGDVYDGAGSVTGQAGVRKRTPHANLPAFELNDDILLAPAAAPCAAAWLQTDDAKPKGPLTVKEAAAHFGTDENQILDAVVQSQLDWEPGADDQPLILPNERFAAWSPPLVQPPVNETFAATWDDAIRLAASHPLERLVLTARTPAAAALLSTLAQPFGAQSLTLHVTATGKLKDGGTVNFSAQGLKLGHALKPLDDAARFLRAMGEGAQYRASLTLSMQGTLGAVGAAPFEVAQAQAGDDITPEATFGESA